MNPLKSLFNKVFETTTPVDAAKAPPGDAAFEWNPESEIVAPTSARASSWKRTEISDDGPKGVSGVLVPGQPAAPSSPAREAVASVSPAEAAPFLSLATSAPAQALRPESSPPPEVADVQAAFTGAPSPPARTVPPPAPPSDFEDVYRKAGIKSPVHGYGVERVYRLLTSRRLVGLDRSVRRSALLTALDAAGVPASDVSQDAVLRRKALTAFEAEKALELQSLRSRNESRAEALQDTVETFTRQKQGQIERLAQGSTSAVRAQSDLEIRKRMEQDRLFRSLAYFVEPLPSTIVETRGVPAGTPRIIERFAPAVEVRPAVPAEEPMSSEPSFGAARPISPSGLEMALRAAAEEARTAGWGQAAVVEDAAVDPVEALRKLREAKKTESDS